MIKTLNEMNVGDAGRVVSLSGEGQIQRRLLDMGVTPGIEINVVRFAPLGDPIEIKLRNYFLSLRKNEALNISVEVTHSKRRK